MLRKPELSFYDTTEIKPGGWLERQLRIQADSLSSKLVEFWPDIRDSAWIGGNAEGWERVPYWLDGFIPLAWLLDDDALKSIAKRYIYGIIDAQEEDGWICPCKDRGGYDLWAYLLILKVLVVYYRASGDEAVIKPLNKALRCINRHTDPHTLNGWGQTRWFEGLIAVFFMYERTGEDWLIDLAVKLRGTGFDWKELFCGKSYPYAKFTEKGHWGQLHHVVNNAMMLKGNALYSLLSEEQSDLDFAETAYNTLMKYHGMATGMFSGDECLSGNSPFQGTELCSVTEFMYSCEWLVAITGDMRWADRLERATLNALPATFSPDMMNHQYVQQVNQPYCVREENPHFHDNGPEANLFGVEPNYGCCTSNMHQGWPKYAESAFLKAADGVAVISYVPAELCTKVNNTEVNIVMDTGYPFEDSIRFTVSCERETEFALKLRVPGWCEAPDFGGGGVIKDDCYIINKVWPESSSFTVTFPMKAKFESRPRELTVLSRGPLLYSMYIKERWEKQSKPDEPWYMENYELYNEEDWQYAMAADPETLVFESHEIAELPFNPQTPPISVKVACRKINWPQNGFEFEATPDFSSLSDSVEIKRFIPYGCSMLRMTEMPNLPLK